jgi:hypothetical protein
VKTRGTCFSQLKKELFKCILWKTRTLWNLQIWCLCTRMLEFAHQLLLIHDTSIYLQEELMDWCLYGIVMSCLACKVCLRLSKSLHISQELALILRPNRKSIRVVSVSHDAEFVASAGDDAYIDIVIVSILNLTTNIFQLDSRFFWRKHSSHFNQSRSSLHGLEPSTCNSGVCTFRRSSSILNLWRKTTIFRQ